MRLVHVAALDEDAPVVTVELSRRDLAAIRYTMSSDQGLTWNAEPFAGFKALADEYDLGVEASKRLLEGLIAV